MDRSRDERRGGARRFSPAKRHTMSYYLDMKGNGGGSVFAKKMKKERMRRLSVVSKANSINENCEMGCAAAGSDGEHELRSTTSTTKKFKLPKKFFYDCNTVDHVPRKLRSAMKKHNRDSISPPLPDDKPNHGINGDGFPRKIGTKKSRLNQQGGDYSNGSQSVGPITKDEEEVVETLYALADMFPSNNENGSDGELTEAKSWPLPEGENSKPAFEAPEEKDSKSLCPSNKAEEGFLEGSDQETVEVKCSNGSSLPGSPKSIQLQTNCEDAISQTNGQAMSQSELSQRICSSKQTKHEEAAACARKPEVEAAGVGGQSQLQYILKESRYSSLPLAGSHGVGTQGPSLQSPSDITFLGMAVSATPSGSVNNCPLSNKDSRGPVARKKSWKRCSAHVYISRLIKVLQIAEKTDRSPAQLTSNEESKQGVRLTTENLHGVRNGLNGLVSGHSVVASAAENNTNEVRNESLLHKRLLLDQQQASTTSPFYASQNQNFDFLSLSNGGSGVEASNSWSKLGNGLDPSTQIQIPYPFMPFSVSENCFSSALSTYHLQVAAAKQVHIQSPPYMGSQLLGSPHLSNSALPKQQQRWIWTPQVAAAQQNPVGSCIPNWQHGRHEYPSSAVHYAQNLAGSQPILPPSYSSLEVLGPKYAPLSQQQQQQ
ncbi:uncharacterized protein LOC131329831 isoform X3 [Rhododendron vialii]|uniref:uncharacterized protein LOC131329831 isoform X3 n=2 Tax=Rhododendron vialii TaxID=182163 RepID=UPI00265D8D5D|nr:uncharacterized protein LOC131329831 isoform X3 [Rhododendron vialii]